jgi:hypothetical protein
VAVFECCGTVLLVSVWAGNKVSYTNLLEEGIKANIFSTPIRLDRYNLAIEQTFNHRLELMKTAKNFRLMFEEISPSKFAEIIYKTHIIILPAKRIKRRTPHIREN